MDVTTFQCPHCRAALRMRGRQTAGSRFRCPDCQTSLQIEQTKEGKLSLTPLDPEPEPQGPSRLKLQTRVGLESLHRGAKYLGASPVLMSWLVAGTGGFLILLMILLDESPTAPAQPASEVASDTEPAQSPEKNAAGNKEAEQPAAETPDTDTPMLVEVAPEPVPAEPVAAGPAPHENQQHDVAEKQSPPLVAQRPDPADAQPANPATDVTVALEIPILEFRQPKKIPLKTLIVQFEEMLDTEFQIADNVKSDPRLLETPVSFSQKNTTISRLLAQILGEAALTFTVKSNKIYIERAEGS